LAEDEENGAEKEFKRLGMSLNETNERERKRVLGNACWICVARARELDRVERG
jgi:hypothetical protein